LLWPLSYAGGTHEGAAQAYRGRADVLPSRGSGERHRVASDVVPTRAGVTLQVATTPTPAGGPESSANPALPDIRLAARRKPLSPSIFLLLSDKAPNRLFSKFTEWIGLRALRVARGGRGDRS
jgi:hypothetical protein